MIQLRSVTKKYKNKYALKSVDLDILSGEFVFIVGKSGAGKSTLIKMLYKEETPSSGTVIIGGINIANLPPEKVPNLRRCMGIVFQDYKLIDTKTVFENIAYGLPNASREDVITAAKQAGAHEFISALPDGYDTYVGERGVKLSGGQKQRISIARVFLKNPPILILDEATSALDNESEKLVQESLEKLSKGRTVFTIAHRLTTIRNASLILVLTENGIEEKGSHEELLAKKGIYYNLYSMYANM